MTVAVVDEGILNLAQYKTPDPYKGLHLKPEYDARWFDSFGLVVPYTLHKGLSAFGSDTGFEDAMDVTRIKPMAWWSGIVATDEKGFLKLTVPVGDYTGKVRVMVVGWSGNQTGSQQQSIPVFAPLDMHTSLPRVFGAFDKSQAVAEVFNNSETKMNIDLTIDITGPLKITDGRSKTTMTIEAKRSKTFVWNLEGIGIPGKATILFKSDSGDLERIRSTELLVRPPGPQLSQYSMFMLKEGESKRFNIPEDWEMMPGSGVWSVTTSSSPVVKLGPHLKNLVAYPHGCAEQTTSRLISMILLKPVLGAALLDDYLEDSSVKLEEFIDSGIKKLTKMQMSDGGFSYWQGGSYQYEWINTYVTHFLWLARYLGYSIPEEMIENAISKIKSQYHNTYQPDVMAYSGFVLALYGQMAKSDLPVLIRKLNLETPGNQKDSKPYRIANPLAEATMRLAGLQHQTKNFFKSLPKPNLELKEDYWWYDSSFLYQESAFASRLYADSVQSETKAVAELLQFLEYLSQKSYLSTHTAAWVLLAVNQVFSLPGSESVIRITQGGNKAGEIGTGAGSNFASGRFNNTATNQIEISHQDKGNQSSIFGILKLSGWPSQPPSTSYENKLTLNRLFFTEDATPIDLPTTVKQGNRVFVLLAVEQHSGIFDEIENVAIEDWLPAGFELENPRLMSENSVFIPEELMGASNLDVKQVDYLDDRIVIFATVSKEKKHFLYSIKAVSPGDYQVLPVKAEAMYLPDFRALKVETNRVSIGSGTKFQEEESTDSPKPYQKFIKM